MLGFPLDINIFTGLKHANLPKSFLVSEALEVKLVVIELQLNWNTVSVVKKWVYPKKE